MTECTKSKQQIKRFADSFKNFLYERKVRRDLVLTEFLPLKATQ